MVAEGLPKIIQSIQEHTDRHKISLRKTWLSMLFATTSMLKDRKKAKKYLKMIILTRGKIKYFLNIVAFWIKYLFKYFGHLD